MKISKSSKIKLILTELAVLLFVVIGILMIVNPEDDSSIVGWIAIIFFGGIGIYAPFAFSKKDAETACPNCGEPGALEVTNQEFIRSEPIVKTVDTYRGEQVKPYQVTGHRSHYFETLTCKHCGYSEKVRTWYDNWDVSV